MPLSAIIFGGRRAKLAPLVYESFNWQHGTYVGATMASETTTAATGAVGVVRRDPMAMLPFCGYHIGDYFRHWLDMGKRIKNAPKIFHVNWFRTGPDGKFIWPGFGENLRVLEWVVQRAPRQNTGGPSAGTDAVESPIGYLPKPESIRLDGTSVTKDVLASQLLNVDRNDWVAEAKSLDEFFSKFEDTLPAEIRNEEQALLKRFAA